MRPSKMKKDGSASIRINKGIKKILENSGVSIQKIIDDYIDKNVSVEIKDLKCTAR